MSTPIMKKSGAKPNRIVKAKKNARRSTPHTKNYRFQSFSDRITNLKIDPVRRKRHVEKEEVVEENTHSYFGSSLEAWKDTNLSQTFTDFARAATPLSDNLPMVLHNEEGIMNLLVEYIEKGDELAMEPLLALLAHFAHDLDTRFEAHFQRAVSTVAAIAAKHPDFAVIEWSFTCLAWLFKYLSRLLTPDLRPLYDLLAPYLGQKEVKPFIVRFTAEALSFLLRKAAVIYQRDEEPLDRVMEHMLKDCKNTMANTSADLLQQGTMTLLTESVKGIQHGIHSSGVPVMLSFFKHAEENLDDGDQVMENVASGVLTSLIHHCMDGSFQTILDALLAYIDKTILTPTNQNVRFCSTMLFTVISVRKGSRISDWKAVMKAVKGLITAAGGLPELTYVAAHPALALLAIALQTSSIDAVLATRQTIENLRSGKWSKYFLTFCDMVSRLGLERFNDFVLSHLQKFVLEHSQTASLELCTLLPRFAKSKPGTKFKCPSKMVDALLTDISAVESGLNDASEDKTVLGRANMALSALPYLVSEKEQNERLETLLLGLVRKGLDQGGALQDFALGPGLEHDLVQREDITDTEILDLWIPLCAASSDLASLPSFWSNLVRFIKKCKPSNVTGPHIETLESSLVASLCSPSHSIRTDALHILQALYRIRDIPEPEALAAAITIESTPASLDTARSISMNIRRMASEFAKLTEDDLMVRAIPTYCFGLLHVQLSQAWDDATTALASMCQSKAGEDVVMTLAQSWIDGKASTEDDEVQLPTIVDVDTDGFKVFSDFECPNLAKISAISKQVFTEPLSGLPSPTQKLALDLKRVPVITPTARSQALRVLHKIPHIAEKRSRILVPVLLKWAAGSQSQSADEDTADRWARKDQKAMLAVFSQFFNPSVLFRSSEVHTALLALCANGDVEIQQSALKAILAWKETSVVRYKEHLTNLLDEARFREELSVFLRGESRDEEEGIRPEDYAGLMPVLLRVLYGRAVAGGKEGQAGRRKAIFVALSRFGRDTLEQFLDIALSSVVDLQSKFDITESGTKAPLRQQLGMMYMLNDMLQVLGAELEPSISKLMNGILACTANASQMVEKSSAEEESADLAMLRSIRQTGVQCLVKIFSTMSDFDTRYYGQLIAGNLIVPRLQAFANENAQSVSGSLRLISAWTAHPTTATLFTRTGGQMLESVAALLQSPHSKDEVRLFILQHILDNLFHDTIENEILQPRVSGFVQAIGAVIEQQPNKEILDACVKSFSMLAGRITSQNEAVIVTRICTDLLKKPGKAVSPWIKTGLLRTLAPLIERFEVSGAKESLYPALCALFSRLKDSESRILLADVLSKLVRDDEKLVYAASICADMNAAGTRLDEPDHERRDMAFKKVYQDFATLSLEQWLPIVHNCLFYIRDGEDRVNRTSSSRALELYIDAAADHESESTWLVFTEQSILAGIEFGIKEQSELVRSEYLAVLGHLVEKLPAWQKIQGMQGLLVGGDEEASVFTNLLHIQQHRRLRALRRVKEESANLGSANVSKIWIPLVEHFVFDADGGDAGRGLADEGVLTIGAMATALSKTAFRGTFTRYAGYLKTRPDFEKIVLRLLGALVDGKKKEVGDSDTKAILSEQLPPLMEYLHKKDESTVDRRMPVAVTIVKLLKSLPEEEFKARLPAVLTDVSHVLRSKSQEARDQTRKALATIASLVGSQYFGFILKELRGALKRGPQLHVLSYTVHSLLVQGNFETGELAECLPHLMMVVMDDVFGETGAEKDAEEYRSAMKEVKSSKSFDTLELLARTTAVKQLGALVAPIRSLLEEKVDMKTVKKVDELFIRLRKGLDMNPESDSTEMLTFCWEIVQTVRLETEAKAVAKAPKKVDERVQRYLIQPEEPKKSKSRGSTASYSFKLISFSLNLLRKILKRHEDLQTPQKMKGFLPVAGDALVVGQEEVKLAALRFLATIMRVAGLTELDENAPVYLKESFDLLKAAPSLTTDSAKAALELVTSVLRERRSVIVKERDLALLLKKLKTDIDEPDRQVIVYKFLRAVLGRKIVMAEVYEVLDAVGEVMVQNPTGSIREAARSAYLQFVLEYPQGKDRWVKQTTFLTANLKFEHASGRMSVMEFLSLLVGKVSEEVLGEIAGTIFLHLMPVLCSDVDAKCRAMSGLLIGRIFERVGEKELAKMTALMGKGSWLGEGKKAEVRGGALQCWSILLRSRENLLKKQLEILRGDVQDVLDGGAEDGELVQPQLVLHALRTMTALVDVAPDVALSKSAAGLWTALRSLPVNSETMEAIQETVANLLGTFFTDVASSSSKTPKGLAGLPLRGTGGLEISGQDMRQLCSTELRALRAIVFKTSDVLITQIVRNLVFLGRCFAANGMIWNEKAEEDEDSDDAEEDQKTTPPESNTALEYLFRRLSSALQADKFALASRNAALQTISALLNQLETVPALQHVLRPLYNLTDSSIPQPPGELYKALADKAQEVMDVIQKKVGAEHFVEELGKVRAQAKGRREGRRQKRRIEAVAEPERWAKEKKKKYESKKIKAKSKGEEARGKRRGW